MLGQQGPLGELLEKVMGFQHFSSHVLKFMSTLSCVFSIFLSPLGPISKFLSILGGNFITDVL